MSSSSIGSACPGAPVKAKPQKPELPCSEKKRRKCPPGEEKEEEKEPPLVCREDPCRYDPEKAEDEAPKEQKDTTCPAVKSPCNFASEFEKIKKKTLHVFEDKCEDEKKIEKPKVVPVVPRPYVPECSRPGAVFDPNEESRTEDRGCKKPTKK